MKKQDEFTIKLNIAIKKSGMKKGYIAEKMGLSPSQYSNRVAYCKFTIAERQQIAEIIRCKFVVYAEDQDGNKAFGNSGSEIIREALKVKGMTQTQLAEKMGLTRQGVSFRLKQGKLSNEEIRDYLKAIGFEYVFYFEFPDGEKI